MNTVTSTTSSKLQPAAASGVEVAERQPHLFVRSGSGEPSSRLPTWPETNRKPLALIAGE